MREQSFVCFFLHRNFLNHGLNGGELIFSAEGHEHRSRTDGGVKALGKTSFEQMLRSPAMAFILSANSPLIFFQSFRALRR